MNLIHYIVTVFQPDGNIKELTYNDLEEAKCRAVDFRLEGFKRVKLHKREMTFTELDAFEGWSFTMNKKSIKRVKTAINESIRRGKFTRSDLVEFLNCITACHQFGFSNIDDAVDFINNLENNQD